METKEEIEIMFDKMILTDHKEAGNNVFYLNDVHKNKGVTPPNGYKIIFISNDFIKSNESILGKSIYMNE